jgi:hypothetical protein
MHEGSCLCGAVVFEITGTFPPPDACHRSQYRKHAGHCIAASDALAPRRPSTAERTSPGSPRQSYVVHLIIVRAPRPTRRMP